MIDIKWLQKLNDSDELKRLEWIHCKQDPYYWLTTWAKTLNAHDEENPKQPFPDKEYIKILTKLWIENKLMLIPKSRQMMMSWLFVALYLWDAQFHKARLIFFQSKKADDANDLIRRAMTIWNNEPEFLKYYYDKDEKIKLVCNPQNGGDPVYNLMTFPMIDSEIRGIPEGGDVIRMQTASGILEDEMAFQPAARAAYTGAKPTISSKGRFTGVSTPEDGTFFQECVFDGWKQ